MAKSAAPPDLDAFEATESEVVVFEAPASPPPGNPDGFVKLELMASLQDIKLAAKSNGDNYDITYEVDVEGFVRLAVESARGAGSYSATWNKLFVGNGAELRRGAMTRNADGEMQYRISIHLPQSEISRSLGRLGSMLGSRASLILEPEQGTLGLAGGGSVDLTSKAE